jgi:hypothetical protein
MDMPGREAYDATVPQFLANSRIRRSQPHHARKQ